MKLSLLNLIVHLVHPNHDGNVDITKPWISWISFTCTAMDLCLAKCHDDHPYQSTILDFPHAAVIFVTTRLHASYMRLTPIQGGQTHNFIRWK